MRRGQIFEKIEDAEIIVVWENEFTREIKNGLAELKTHLKLEIIILF